MGKVVHRLAAQGLVAVRDDPADARSKRVAITAAGIAMRHDCVAALEPEIARVREALGDDTLASLLPGLRRLRQWLDTHR